MLVFCNLQSSVNAISSMLVGTAFYLIHRFAHTLKFQNDNVLNIAKVYANMYNIYEVLIFDGSKGVMVSQVALCSHQRSIPRTRQRTANKCGNIFVLPRCDDRDDRPNQFQWLKLLHYSYFFLWIKYIRIGSCIRSIKILKPKEIHATFVMNKFWKCERHVCRHCVISRATFA